MQIFVTKFVFSEGKYRAFIPERKLEFFCSSLKGLIEKIKSFVPKIIEKQFENIFVFQVMQQDLKILIRDNALFREHLLTYWGKVWNAYIFYKLRKVLSSLWKRITS